MMLIVMHRMNVNWMMMMMRQHHLLNNGGEGNVSDLHHQDGWALARESYASNNNNEPLGESVDYYNDNIDDDCNVDYFSYMLLINIEKSF